MENPVPTLAVIVSPWTAGLGVTAGTVMRCCRLVMPAGGSVEKLLRPEKGRYLNDGGRVEWNVTFENGRAIMTNLTKNDVDPILYDFFTQVLDGDTELKARITLGSLGSSGVLLLTISAVWVLWLISLNSGDRRR